MNTPTASGPGPDPQPPRAPDAKRAASADPEPEDDLQLSFMEHLHELRDRLQKAVVMVLFTTLASYAQADAIYLWLVQPVLDALPADHRQLYFIDPVGPIFVSLKVAALAGVFLAAPFWLYQVWAFVAPGLYRRERRLVAPFLVLGTLLFGLGGWLAHRYMLPFAFQYIIAEFSGPDRAPMLDIGATLDIVLVMELAFGLVFELPLVLALLARMGVVRASWLAKHRRIAMVVNVIVAAVITPTGDPFNLMLMAVPLILFYELGIVAARMVEPREDAPPPDEADKKD